jgi:signal transduction histidine kinase
MPTEDAASREGERSDWDTAYAILAHGLLTPLSVIRGLTEALIRQDGLNPEDRQMYLSRIMENADFVSTMLSDMVRGLPPEAWSLLDELGAEGARRYLATDDEAKPPDQ